MQWSELAKPGAHREEAHGQRAIGQQAHALLMTALRQARVECAAQQAAGPRKAARFYQNNNMPNAGSRWGSSGLSALL